MKALSVAQAVLQLWNANDSCLSFPVLGVMDRSLHATFTFSSLPGFPLGTVTKGTLVISTGQSRQSAIRFWKLQMKNQPVSNTLQTLVVTA